MDQIKDQFTKQAAPFAEFHIHKHEDSLLWMREELHLTGHKVIVDVGCGPLAPHVKQVIGVDATTAMLAKGKEIFEGKGFTNYSFVEGLMEKLPLPNNSFDGVVTRYTFHHLINPSLAIAEMVRICKPL
jgi:ubiquinone/menaquinone biosynthesis C-methylase UbiE